MKPSDGANPNCSDCGGEGVCEYAMGEDCFTDLCETCYGKDSTMDDLVEDDAYDQFKDECAERGITLEEGRSELFD